MKSIGLIRQNCLKKSESKRKRSQGRLIFNASYHGRLYVSQFRYFGFSGNSETLSFEIYFWRKHLPTYVPPFIIMGSRNCICLWQQKNCGYHWRELDNFIDVFPQSIFSVLIGLFCAIWGSILSTILLCFNNSNARSENLLTMLTSLI